MPRPTLYHTPEEKRVADAAKAKRWRERNPEAAKATKRKHIDKDPEAYRAQARVRYHKDPEKHLARNAKWREANLEYCKAKDRERYEANPAPFLAKLAQWRIDNPEKYAEYRRRATSRMKKKHRATHAAYENNRRANMLRATVTWSSPELILECYELARLRTKLTGIQWVVDHIVPLNSDMVCGLHCEANLQVIPAVTNTVKLNLWWPDMPAAPSEAVTFADRPSGYLAAPTAHLGLSACSENTL